MTDVDEIIDLDVSDPDDERKWIVLFDEDYDNVMLDGNDNVALLVNEKQAFEVWRLATQTLQATTDLDLDADLSELGP